MDWIALHTSDLWHGFFVSPEIQARKQALYNQLVRAQLDPETRGEVRGQIKMLESLEDAVKGLAARQQTEIERQETPVPQTRMERIAAMLPRIY